MSDQTASACKLENQIHIMDCKTTIKETIKDIVLTKKISDPFFIFDLGNVVDKIKMWQKKLPRVKPFYTMKCNDNAFMLQTLAAFDVNFNCASKSEIKNVLHLKVNPSRIIFGNPVKLVSHIKYAMNQCVDLTTFDSELELFKLKSIYPSCKLIIRICIDTELKYPLSKKYGCDPQTEAPALLSLSNNLGLSVVGVSFHVGFCSNKVAAFKKGIDASANLFNLTKQLGFNMYLLNIGGGFSEDENSSLNDIIDTVNNALNKCFPPENNVTIIAEPGRYFVSSSFTLAAKIHSLKKVEGDKDHMMYFINDGVYGSFSGVIYGHKDFVPKPLNDYPTSPIFESSIWGPSCDGLDQVVNLVNLPLMKMNDWFIFKNMGAYTIPIACTFNGFPLPKIFAVANHSIWNTLKNLTQLSENNFTTETIVEAIRMVSSVSNDKDDNFDDNSVDLTSFEKSISLT